MEVERLRRALGTVGSAAEGDQLPNVDQSIGEGAWHDGRGVAEEQVLVAVGVVEAEIVAAVRGEGKTRHVAQGADVALAHGVLARERGDGFGVERQVLSVGVEGAAQELRRGAGRPRAVTAQEEPEVIAGAGWDLCQ